MGAAQIIRTETGEELVVLQRRDYDALLASIGDEAAEDAMSLRLIAERRGDFALPALGWEAIEAGENPIVVLRRFRSMTQAELAAAAKVDESLIASLEQDHRLAPPETLEAIAQALQAPADIFAD
jgi:DNA-binding XRE family transcriptional regulator